MPHQGMSPSAQAQRGGKSSAPNGEQSIQLLLAQAGEGIRNRLARVADQELVDEIIRNYAQILVEDLRGRFKRHLTYPNLEAVLIFSIQPHELGITFKCSTYPSQYEGIREFVVGMGFPEGVRLDPTEIGLGTSAGVGGDSGDGVSSGVGGKPTRGVNTNIGQAQPFDQNRVGSGEGAGISGGVGDRRRRVDHRQVRMAGSGVADPGVQGATKDMLAEGLDENVESLQDS